MMYLAAIILRSKILRCCYFLLCFILPHLACSQEIQWAYRLLGFSSEHQEGNHPAAYSAKQVLGKPNKLPAFGMSAVAWLPKAIDKAMANGEEEWVKIGFRKQMKIRQIAVGENCSVGSITQIWLYDTESNAYLVYGDTLPTTNHLPIQSTQKTEEKIQGNPAGAWLRVFLPLTNYEVVAAKVVLNSMKNWGQNQIDAIGISDSENPIEATIVLPEIIQKTAQDTTQATGQNNLARPEKLPATINTSYNELLPVIAPDGKTLYFDRQAHPENTAGKFVNDDIWVANRNETGSFGLAWRLPAPLNNANHNYVCSVSADGNTLLLANAYQDSTKQVREQTIQQATEDTNPNAANNSAWRGGVALVQKTAKGTWTAPENLNLRAYYNLSPHAEFQLTNNNQILLLAIEQFEGYGGRDLYVSFLETDRKTWTKPKNLGAILNTAASEITPFLAADNKTLYFASNGFSGYGDMDMFMSKRLDDTWTNWTPPVNLGKPFNTANWDAAYTLDASGETAYFVRQSDDKDTDIWQVKLPPQLRPELPEKISPHHLLPEKLEVGQVLRLQTILFEQGTANLLVVSYQELDEIVKAMLSTPTLEIEVIGHTDIEGSPMDNMKLSKDRVQRIQTYLVQQGIATQRIKTKAFGSQRPLTRQRDEQSKQLNRRVEIKVLKK